MPSSQSPKPLPTLTQLCAARVSLDTPVENFSIVPNHILPLLRYPMARKLNGHGEKLDDWLESHMEHLRNTTPSAARLLLLHCSDLPHSFHVTHMDATVISFDTVPKFRGCDLLDYFQPTSRHVTATSSEFHSQLQLVTDGLLNNLTWNGIALVGASVLFTLTDPITRGPHWLQTWRACPITLILLRDSTLSIEDRLRNILSCFKNNRPGRRYWIWRGIASISIVSDEDRRIDILQRIYDGPLEWLLEEPVDALGLLWDGLDLTATPCALRAIETSSNSINFRVIEADRRAFCTDNLSFDLLSLSLQGFALRLSETDLAGLYARSETADLGVAPRVKFRRDMNEQRSFVASLLPGGPPYPLRLELRTPAWFTEGLNESPGRSYLDSSTTLLRHVAFVEWVIQHDIQLCAPSYHVDGIMDIPLLNAPSLSRLTVWALTQSRRTWEHNRSHAFSPFIPRDNREMKFRHLLVASAMVDLFTIDEPALRLPLILPYNFFLRAKQVFVDQSRHFSSAASILQAFPLSPDPQLPGPGEENSHRPCLVVWTQPAFLPWTRTNPRMRRLWEILLAYRSIFNEIVAYSWETVSEFDADKVVHRFENTIASTMDWKSWYNDDRTNP
ncbi:hypothetical protein MIND_00382000 [Mycena indigotica]|uniref:Uncharacterized protein n=1 Tax=Mycena indigotica TaxID=2126181 RepID=A0A8H6T496_9AGAR|nr:uncharacterized protein MIND_00382000 [Mycena indigotica]KAF7310087.1 hypothetical protein MIND_00382000 [Mycena indigotica]